MLVLVSIVTTIDDLSTFDHSFYSSLLHHCASRSFFVGDAVIRRVIFTSRQATTIAEWSAHEDQEERATKVVIECSDFQYTPGQYADIKIPDISLYEWHPFTITSAPTTDDGGKVVFYIKEAAGRWTNQLYKIASSQQDGKEQVQKLGVLCLHSRTSRGTCANQSHVSPFGDDWIRNRCDTSTVHVATFGA
jgi:predicted ferric reductase